MVCLGKEMRLCDWLLHWWLIHRFCVRLGFCGVDSVGMAGKEWDVLWDEKVVCTVMDS